MLSKFELNARLSYADEVINHSSALYIHCIGHPIRPTYLCWLRWNRVSRASWQVPPVHLVYSRCHPACGALARCISVLFPNHTSSYLNAFHDWRFGAGSSLMICSQSVSCARMSALSQRSCWTTFSPREASRPMLTTAALDSTARCSWTMLRIPTGTAELSQHVRLNRSIVAWMRASPPGRPPQPEGFVAPLRHCNPSMWTQWREAALQGKWESGTIRSGFSTGSNCKCACLDFVLAQLTHTRCTGLIHVQDDLGSSSHHVW